MLLFRDEEHVDRWCAQWRQPRGAVLSTVQAWQLAQAWFANKLRPDWRRATLEEAEELLARLELRGDFWNLRS